MHPLPIRDWQTALDEMAAALDRALASHDAVHTGEELVAAESPPGETGERLSRFSQQQQDWEARLTAASELAADVERELDRREAEITRWQGMFNGWRDLIQQKEAAPDSPESLPEPAG